MREMRREIYKIKVGTVDAFVPMAPKRVHIAVVAGDTLMLDRFCLIALGIGRHAWEYQ